MNFSFLLYTRYFSIQKSLIFVRIKEAIFVSIFRAPNSFQRLYYENIAWPWIFLCEPTSIILRSSLYHKYLSTFFFRHYWSRYGLLHPVYFVSCSAPCLCSLVSLFVDGLCLVLTIRRLYIKSAFHFSSSVNRRRKCTAFIYCPIKALPYFSTFLSPSRV